MERINESVICIYHKKSHYFYCLDGIASAFGAWNNGAKHFIPGTYFNNESIKSRIGVNNKIYIVDYSMPKKDLDEISLRNQVIVIDHHIGQRDDLLNSVSDSISVYFDNEKSGATLTWQTFGFFKTPKFLHYVEDGDLFNFREPESKKVVNGLYTLARPQYTELEIFAAFDSIACMSKTELVSVFKPIGELSMEFRKLRIEKIISSNLEIRELSDGKKVGIVEIDSSDLELVSSIGHKICSENQVDFACIWNQDKESEFKFVSFRADQKSDYDCLPMAKKFGGGGHKKACGCRVKNIEDLFA